MSLRISGKDLLVRKEAAEAETPKESKLVLTLPIKHREVVGPSSGYTHRWVGS